MGVGWGCHCADIGAGSGSVTTWMSHRVGAGGRVDAFDLDVSLIPRAENITAIQCDVANHELTEKYDVIYMRFLLVHMPNQEILIDRLVDALKPGGSLVVVESDYASWSMPRDIPQLGRVQRAYLAAIAELGWDTSLGARLPELLARPGLEGITAEGFVQYDRGGSVGHRLVAGSINAMKDRLLATRLASDADVGVALEALADPAVAMRYVTTWACSGRRPASRDNDGTQRATEAP
ncbi:class I SAM-dependent methyltransferase [Micromonospora chalcea]